MIAGGEKQQILTSEKLEAENIWNLKNKWNNESIIKIAAN